MYFLNWGMRGNFVARTQKFLRVSRNRHTCWTFQKHARVNVAATMWRPLAGACVWRRLFVDRRHWPLIFCFAFSCRFLASSGSFTEKERSMAVFTRCDKNEKPKMMWCGVWQEPHTWTLRWSWQNTVKCDRRRNNTSISEAGFLGMEKEIHGTTILWRKPIHREIRPRDIYISKLKNGENVSKVFGPLSQPLGVKVTPAEAGEPYVPSVLQSWPSPTNIAVTLDCLAVDSHWIWEPWAENRIGERSIRQLSWKKKVHSNMIERILFDDNCCTQDIVAQQL